MMTNLIDGILNYLSMDNTGALMVSGEWGCGKSYHIKNSVIPALKENGYNSIFVSLFGIDNLNRIPLMIAENYKGDSNTNDEKKDRKTHIKNLSRWAAKGTKAITSVTWLSQFVNMDTLVNGNSTFLYKLIPNENTVIFLDDIERVIGTGNIDIHALLGTINGLVEHQGYKVVVIANNSYIQNQGEEKMVFKEKVIEKTLVYKPDVANIFKEICRSSNYKNAFVDFMMDNKSIEVINPNCDVYLTEKGILADLHNIRILKFALSHFNKIYEVCTEFLNDKDSLESLFIRSLWATTVGLSVEYKKNRLSYRDREQFVGYIDILEPDWQIDDEKSEENLFEQKANTDIDIEQEKTNQNALQRISYLFKVFVKSHQLMVISSQVLFDFITAGIPLDVGHLKKEWDSFRFSFSLKRINPEDQLLFKFQQEPWEMSNEEMKEGLIELAKYVKEGIYSDNKSYVTAASSLLRYHELTPYTEDEISIMIREGIDKMYSRMQFPDPMELQNLMALDREQQRFPWVVHYEKQKMEERMDSLREIDILEVKRQFNEDLPALAARLIVQDESTKSPEFLNYPILSKIEEIDIINKFKQIQPREVVAIYRILKSRLIKNMNPKIYDDELQFVRRLRTAIKGRQPQEKQFSDVIIENDLNVIIDGLLKDKD